MAAKLRIQDGAPLWLSQAIVPSRDTVVSPSSSPTLATPNVTSTDVFVYVKVDNTGTVDFSSCTCSLLGPWTAPALFQGFFGNANGNAAQTANGVTFTASPLGDSLSGGVNFQFGLSASGRRAWAWSPDGRLFGYVGSPNGNDWYLTIVALQPITRSNGTTIAKGSVAASANGVFAGANPALFWNNANFSWARSKAVIAAGAYAGGGNAISVAIACPEAPGTNVWGDVLATFPGQIVWAFLASPCGAMVAFAPKRSGAAAPPQNFFQVSTASASLVSFRKNNLPQSVASTGPNPSITTNQHAANGVSINTGSGTTIDVDDPECTFVPGGVVVRVDRVKASTLPSANLGVISVGSAVSGTLNHGQSQWVQVPNQHGWANQADRHWCLLAQAYTADLTTVPPSWSGQASGAPPFPIGNDECAQRNIEILP